MRAALISAASAIRKSITGGRRVEPGEVAAVLEDARQALKGKQKASENRFFRRQLYRGASGLSGVTFKAAYPFRKAGDFSGIRISEAGLSTLRF